MKDIDYFYEKDLDVTNVTGFCNRLPSRLERIFRASAKCEIINGNVLQGYRGPAHMCNNGSGDSASIGSYCGIQEIRHWWGMRKDINFIPFIGTPMFLGARIAQAQNGTMDWGYLYFDSKTGECLSSSKSDALDKLHAKGVELHDSGRFAEALEYFNNLISFGRRGRVEEDRNRSQAEIDASDSNDRGNDLYSRGDYQGALNEYEQACRKSNRGIYRSNRDKAQKEIGCANASSEADRNYEQGMYTAAAEKYEEAYRNSDSAQQRAQFSLNRDKARNEAAACRLNEEGDDLFNRGRYDDAAEKYNEASELTEIRSQRRKYRNNYSKTQTEIEASDFFSEGDRFFNNGQYHEASNSYDEALNHSTVDAQRNKYRAAYRNSRIEVQAMNLHTEGDDLLNLGLFNEAEDKYREAYNTSRQDRERENHLSALQRTQVELTANDLFQTADQLFNNGLYDEASVRYNEAYCQTNVDAQRERYFTSYLNAQAEVDANNLHTEGDELLNVGLFNEAIDKYRDAYNTSKRDQERENHLNAFQKAQVELTALDIHQEADQLFNNGSYVEASVRYNDAYCQSDVDAQRERYLTSYLNAQSEIDANNLHTEGDELFNAGLYNEAEDKYRDAYNISKRNQERENHLAAFQRAQLEHAACDLCEEGDQLFNNCLYVEALAKYREAHESSRVEAISERYNEKHMRAQFELVAGNLNSEGDHLYSLGNYTEAMNRYKEANEQSSVDAQRDIFSTNCEKAQSEVIARDLNSNGDRLFAEGDFIGAATRYEEAFHQSNVNIERDKYAVNHGKALLEHIAKNSNSEADRLFDNGNYNEALDKYQEAYNQSNIDALRTKYSLNCGKARKELAALNLCSEGDALMQQGKHTDALNKYQEAFVNSEVTVSRNKYRSKHEEVRLAIVAANLSVEGDQLFNRGQFEDALDKYQEAFNNSPQDVYNANISKAQSELSAIESKTEADQLFREEKYGQASELYQAACDVTNIAEKKAIFTQCREEVDFIINSITTLDSLWKEAWKAENDDNDQSDIARELFQRVSNESSVHMTNLPNVTLFYQYKTLASAKIQGNELFNIGVELHERGIENVDNGHFEEARELLEEAKSNLERAMEKFSMGKGIDENFESCVECVRKQLEAIANVEKNLLYRQLQTLEIESCDRSGCETDNLQYSQVKNRNEELFHQI